MKITRNVIEDLLPLYLAGEVSDDTRALVETYLESDPELATSIEQSDPIDLNGALEVTRTEEEALKTYIKSRRMLIIFIIFLAGIITCILITIFTSFFTPV